MMIILRPGTTEDKIAMLDAFIRKNGVDVQRIQGQDTTILGLSGDTSRIDPGMFDSFDFVERTMKVAEPYKKANRKYHPQNTVINAGGVEIGGNKIVVMAGPCSVESEEQVLSVARDCKASGAAILRGGAFKPKLTLCLSGAGAGGSGYAQGRRKKNGYADSIRNNEHGIS